LEGERAGFVNAPFDLMCREELVEKPRRLTGFTAHDLITEAGSRGVELMMWLGMPGALGEGVRRVHSHTTSRFPTPAAGPLVMEPAPQDARRRQAAA
jgi:protocatechuate 4,5-dioxygenase beta chain